MAEGDGLENRCGVQASPWVRIPHPPLRDRMPREVRMRAVVIDKPGGPDVLRLSEVPGLTPAPDEVVLATAAAGVNRADLMQRQGFYPPPPGASPYPGLECSGRVTAVGSAVTGLPTGSRTAVIVRW